MENKINSSVFNDLFIFEMANNHQGSLDHGLSIIRSMAEIARRFDINAAVKLQYRDLDTMIHNEYKQRTDVKHIPRFMATRLEDNNCKILVDTIHDEGLLCVITPFDEISVDKALYHGVDILKVASCSAMDWPLLSRIVKTDRPVIVSTGGISLKDIDKVVTYFIHRDIPLGVLHCVSIYPSPSNHLSMNFISKLIKRYPGVTIGYSGHEQPDDLEPIVIAVSKGASIFERHVGIPTNEWKLNAYSSTPEQAVKWVQAAKRAKTICGEPGKKIFSKEEEDSLKTLMRGVYAAKPIPKGKGIEFDDVYFAMPCNDDTMTSGEFGQYRSIFFATRNYKENEPVKEVSQEDDISKIRDVVHAAKGMLNEANIELGHDIQLEISHHYGIDLFPKYGAVLASVVNRSYCKKIIIVFPGQEHPSHRHRKKEETFQVLWGEIEVEMDGTTAKLGPGEKMLIEPGQFHAFKSIKGGIFEEISTTYEREDSIYIDIKIATKDPLERKTVVENW